MNKEFLGIKNILVSFSGGKTSAMMSHILKNKYSKTHNLEFVFANTGQEHEETLIFADRCDKYFNLNLHWIEAEVHHGKRKSSTGKRVCFETATRGHYLFEEMIKKYGIPNMTFPHCTRELKTSPIHNYIKNVLKWKPGSYLTAIGIRGDEIDRINENYIKKKFYYPLADMGVNKDDVNKFWERQPFNLMIPEHLGNCVWCWKKTLKKQMAIIKDCPDAHKIPLMLESKYPTTKKNGKVFCNQKFFRKHKGADDLYEIYESGKTDCFVDKEFNDCKESCEAFI